MGHRLVQVGVEGVARLTEAQQAELVHDLLERLADRPEAALELVVLAGYWRSWKSRDIRPDADVTGEDAREFARQLEMSARLLARNGRRLCAVRDVPDLHFDTMQALAMTRLLQAQLFGVTSTDPATFVAVALGLLSVATMATLVPALRATRVNPTEALRDE